MSRALKSFIFLITLICCFQQVSAQSYEGSFVQFQNKIQKLSLQLNCYASLGAEGLSYLICFRDDVIDRGLPTQTSGCAVRLYDLEKEDFIGFSNSDSVEEKNNFLLFPEACKAGGVKKLLELPIDESATLSEFILSAFSNNLKPIGIYKKDSARITVSARAFQNLLNKIKQNSETGFESSQKPPTALSTTPNTQNTPLPPADAAGAPVGTSNLPKPEKKNTVFDVFFASDRKFDISASDPAKKFIEGRNETNSLVLGKVSVSIPFLHQYGNLELPSVFSVNFSPDSEKYLVLRSVTTQKPEVFFSELSSRVNQSSGKELFLFVHGFNTTFSNAALRTAQMTFDMKFTGAPVFFSWPSETILRYSIAEKNIDWAMPHLLQFITDLAQKSGAEKIHIIAHSMGNRALTNALSKLANQTNLKKPIFQNIILAAPDIDQTIFTRIESAVRSMAKSMTIYFSDNDRALQISEKLHDEPRVGQAKENMYFYSDVDSIDASKVDTSFLGHSYYGSSAIVVNDIAELIVKSLLPAQRSYLTPLRTSTGLPFWQLEPVKH